MLPHRMKYDDVVKISCHLIFNYAPHCPTLSRQRNCRTGAVARWSLFFLHPVVIQPSNEFTTKFRLIILILTILPLIDKNFHGFQIVLLVTFYSPLTLNLCILSSNDSRQYVVVRYFLGPFTMTRIIQQH